ncbi:unnamed protein product [Timema podura]|uniref:SCP domain-containing protein n=1 Tax=Timema podura TaxID=61482 RepID=A0ABN7P3B4_TIMPD|nr:unnamed protein product [Timema podura]
MGHARINYVTLVWTRHHVSMVPIPSPSGADAGMLEKLPAIQVTLQMLPEPKSEVVGHYTQVVWADTKLVGCGLIYYPDGVWNIYYMACNYGPGGNIIGDSLYKEGTPCSECDGGCDITYTGLCVMISNTFRAAKPSRISL